MVTTSSIRVLVCSGNLGNAEPDTKSLHAWIPEDGCCSSVVENQRYPLNHSVEEDVSGRDENPGANANTDREDNGTKTNAKFDLIVVGMQEAIFEEDEVSVADDDLSDHSDDSRGTKSKSNRTRVSDVTEAAHKVSKIPSQTVSALHGLTATRNHTKLHAAGIPALIADGTTVLHQLIQDRLPSYKRLLSFQRGEMRILVYALENDNNNTILVKSVRAQNTGLAGVGANKGGIVAEVTINETTTLTFVTAHLDAHEGIDKFKGRLKSIESILKGTKQFAIPSVYPDVSLVSHACFFMGDLNFRTRYKGQIKVEDQYEDVQQLIAHENWTEIYQADELKKALFYQECLHGFQTLDCNFPPTFKLERGPGFVYKDARTPSYTDRILWKVGSSLERNVKPLAYEPIEDYTTSDHKPIRGAFEVQLNKPLNFPPQMHLVKPSLLQRVRPWGHSGYNRVQPKNLHLYLSDISMDLFDQHSISGSSKAPDTYISMVTSPQELLQAPRTIYQQCVHAIKAALCHSWLQDEYRLITWPSTSIQKDTYKPNWGGGTDQEQQHSEEVHCKLIGHHEDGHPIELGGAMLHLFAFQHKGKGQVDEVIGSFPINLEYLFRWCLMGNGDSSSSNKEQVAADNKNSSSGITIQPTATPGMVSLDIEGPLLKNGLQTGIIRCSLDAWWVKDSLASAAKAHHLAKGLASNDG